MRISDWSSDVCSSDLAVAYGGDGTPIATGRLLPDGHIGRMAVRTSARGSGVGGQVLDALIAQGHGDGHRLLLLHAQTHARRFYEPHGFSAQGAELVEAGIDPNPLPPALGKCLDARHGRP